MKHPYSTDSILTIDLNNSENTFLKIGVLPPQASVLVRLQINSTDIQNNTIMPPYIAADEWLGYPS